MHRADGRVGDRLELLQSLAKTFSLVAIPIIVAGGGWVLRSRLEGESVRREYVQLAVSLLRESDSDPTQLNLGLRAWAVNLLSENSPTTIPDSLMVAFRSGIARLPASAAVGVQLIDQFTGPQRAEATGEIAQLAHDNPAIVSALLKGIVPEGARDAYRRNIHTAAALARIAGGWEASDTEVKALEGLKATVAYRNTSDTAFHFAVDKAIANRRKH